jgi:hypothetical protein
MNLKKKEKRIEELEEKARIKYIDGVDWGEVIEFLSEEEIKEYYALMKEVYDVGK